MTLEITHPELLNRCIRCKKSNGKLNDYFIAKVIGSRITKPFKINFSVCENCKNEVNRIIERGDFIKRVLKWLLIILVGLVLLIWVVAYLFVEGDLVDDWSILIIAMILTFGSIFGVFIIIALVRFYFRFYGLEKYLGIEKDGRVILKDPINKKKSVEFNILTFYNESIAEKSLKTYESCPNCGSKEITYSGYCAVCGKNLKI